MCNDETDKEKKAALHDIVCCARELLDYHNRVIHFSNVMSGSLPVVNRKLNLKKIMDSIIDLESPAAISHNLDINYSFSKEIPEVVCGDEYRVQSIIINLVSNAIKFTSSGHITINVDLFNKEDSEVIIRFQIEDSGIGIPQDKQNYIFEQFSRLSLSNKGLYKGLGIGLRVVKEFIDDLNADLDLKSEEGVGTIFVVSIPFKIPLTNEIIH